MASFYSGDYVGAVVADIGQYSTKVGWAGDDYPRGYFRSNVAVNRDTTKDEKGHSPISDVNYDYFYRSIGQDESAWSVCNPVDTATGLWYDTKPHADWYDLMQKFICHGYSSALKSTTDTHPLLLVERAYNPPPIRQQIIECLFEDLNVPAAFLGKDAALACYGCGRVSGTVVDIGYSGTIVTPVYEGYVEQKGIRSSPIGVCQMDELILKQLDRINNNTPVLPLYQVRGAPTRKHDIHIAARLYLAQECRETGAGAAINTTTANFHAPHKSFTLPDGTMLDIPSKDRFAVSDLLFGNDKDSVSHREEYTERIKKELSSYIDNVTTDDDNNDNDMYSEAAAVGICKRRTTKRGDGVKQLKKPVFSNRILQQACQPYLLSHLDHLTSSPIASMICDAAYRCDRDQQVALLGNVVVGGGGACLGPTEQALPDLIREQVESIIHTHTPGWRVKVLAPGFQERSVLSWLGGSILASMGTFHDMWITKAEYEEWGSAIVNRKCP